MQLVGQTEYRGYTLLHFEQRKAHSTAGTSGYWVIVSPGGVNIVDGPQPTEFDARACVDKLLGPSGTAQDQP